MQKAQKKAMELAQQAYKNSVSVEKLAGVNQMVIPITEEARAVKELAGGIPPLQLRLRCLLRK